jgi:hypothetical protein
MRESQGSDRNCTHCVIPMFPRLIDERGSEEFRRIELGDGKAILASSRP